MQHDLISFCLDDPSHIGFILAQTSSLLIGHIQLLFSIVPLLVVLRSNQHHIHEGDLNSAYLTS